MSREERRACSRPIRRQRARAIEWTFAALNSGRTGDHGPVVRHRRSTRTSHGRRSGARQVEERIHGRLKDVSDAAWRQGSGSRATRFTAGDLLMVSVLRILIVEGFVETYDNLAAYMHRGIAAPGLPARAGRSDGGVHR